jgi:DNA-3-methyladenine glycosylase II
VSRSQLLNDESLKEIALTLTRRDSDLARIHIHFGSPPLWQRRTGFATLVHIILEQQVSLLSAKSMLNRLKAIVVPFTPERFCELGDSYLRENGVTRQKASYIIHLAKLIVTKQLNLAALSRMSDNDARRALMEVKGIGSWSADVYLLMAMRRPDIWPAGDLALAIAIRDLKGLAEIPPPKVLEELAESWRPHRAVAARMLWHFYLERKAAARNTVRRSRAATSKS